jgi:hypothetical protein
MQQLLIGSIKQGLLKKGCFNCFLPSRVEKRENKTWNLKQSSGISLQHWTPTEYQNYQNCVFNASNRNTLRNAPLQCCHRAWCASVLRCVCVYAAIGRERERERYRYAVSTASFEIPSASRHCKSVTQSCFSVVCVVCHMEWFLCCCVFWGAIFAQVFL